MPIGKKKLETNKHKEFWRDTLRCVSRLSRGHVPSVPSYVPSVPWTFCPVNMNFHINHPKRPGCPWDMPNLSLGRFRAIATTKFLYVIFFIGFFLHSQLATDLAVAVSARGHIYATSLVNSTWGDTSSFVTSKCNFITRCTQRAKANLDPRVAPRVGPRGGPTSAPTRAPTRAPMTGPTRVDFRVFSPSRTPTQAPTKRPTNASSSAHKSAQFKWSRFTCPVFTCSVRRPSITKLSVFLISGMLGTCAYTDSPQRQLQGLRDKPANPGVPCCVHQTYANSFVICDCAVSCSQQIAVPCSSP